ncbi:MAG: SDR family NAD(P)-dependent oxidoreductase, partial [Bryobacteraceae bacterium]
MRIDLSGQRALVTGGARGIGAAAAAALRACGAEVHIADILADPPVDVCDPAALTDAFARAAPLDIVVANAGTAIFRRLDETRDEEWRRLLDINLTGAFHTVRLAARQMKPRRRGSIVLTASTNSFDGEADLAAYNATKAGLLGLLRTAANELGPFGIRVNAVCPGLIRTDLTAAHFAQAELLR